MSDVYGSNLFSQHAAMLAASGVTPEHARLRGYTSVDTKARLDRIGVTKAGQRVPGLLVPLLRADGGTWGYQYRPDSPRVGATGKPVKYETPVHQRNGLDVPPGVGDVLGNPAIPLLVTEGTKKADAATLAGLPTVALPGVWSWRGKNEVGGKTAVADWHDVALNGRRIVLAFDSDVTKKKSVRAALVALADYLASKGALVEYLHLPDNGDGKTGLDDFLADGHTAADVWALVRPDLPEVAEVEMGAAAPPTPTATTPEQRPAPAPAPVLLADALAVFRRWLHLPDADPLLAVAAAAVANRTADASPVWLLVIGPPSSGKTEQIVGLAALPESVMAATVTEAALLSGTSAKERASDATGGLLRQVGEHGLLIMKDFTSVLSQNGDARAQSLAALREIYDGHWSRPVGTDGGRHLDWRGKLGVVAGCTNAYDRHYSVISQLGDRFLLVRLAEDDTDPDAQALSIGLAALSHGEGGERRMRAELTAALAGLVAGADMTRTHRPLSDAERLELVRLARYAGVSRTPVDRNPYTGDLNAIPAPEGPGRLVIAYRQVLGGLEAIGVDTDSCWRVLRRLAVDTAPAMRSAVIRALVADAIPRRTSDLGQRAGLVTKTASRILDDLALIGLAEHTKAGEANNSADMWAPTGLLLRLWPESKTEIDPPSPTPQGEEEAERHTVRDAYTAHRQDLSHSTGLPRCADCGNPIHHLAGGECLRCKHEAGAA